MATIKTRKCTKCNQIKNEDKENFPWLKLNGKYIYHSLCRECCRKKDRAHKKKLMPNHATKKKMYAYNRKSYAKNYERNYVKVENRLSNNREAQLLEILRKRKYIVKGIQDPGSQIKINLCSKL